MFLYSREQNKGTIVIFPYHQIFTYLNKKLLAQLNYAALRTIPIIFQVFSHRKYKNQEYAKYSK